MEYSFIGHVDTRVCVTLYYITKILHAHMLFFETVCAKLLELFTVLVSSNVEVCGLWYIPQHHKWDMYPACAK